MRDKTTVENAAKEVGAFSTYQTSKGHAQSLPFKVKPAQQFLAALGVIEDAGAHLSQTADKAPLAQENNQDVNIASFDPVDPNYSKRKLTISGPRVDRLLKSAKVYVNTDILPAAHYVETVKAGTLTSQTKVKSPTLNVAWQNLAVGLCHAQEIDLLAERVNRADKAILAPKQDQIAEDAPALLLLSTPALNFGYGTAKELTKEQQAAYVKGMFQNLFQATLSEGRTHIALPAAGLGVFVGDPDLYFSALMTVAKTFPDLTIIYNPAQFKKEFHAMFKKHQPENVMYTAADVLFLADKLTEEGTPCAFHNPSDADVVLGIYDVGQYWKEGTGARYVGEEHIGAMSTAPLNSRGLNPTAYETIVAQSFQVTLENVQQKLLPLTERVKVIADALAGENAKAAQAIHTFLTNELAAYFPDNLDELLQKYTELVIAADDGYKTERNWPELYRALKDIADIFASLSPLPPELQALINRQEMRADIEKLIPVTPGTDALKKNYDNIRAQLLNERPAQRFLTSLNVEAKTDVLTQGSPSTKKDATFLAFGHTKHSGGTLTITAPRVQQLLNSAKIYVNTNAFPAGTYAKEKWTTEIIRQPCPETGVAWRNMGAGVCHAQEIDFLSNPANPDEGYREQEVSQPRMGAISPDNPTLLLLSTTFLHTSYIAKDTFPNGDAAKYIEAMFHNLFFAATAQNRQVVVLGILPEFYNQDVRSLNIYYDALLNIASEYPHLTIIFRPDPGQSFERKLKASPVKNIRALEDESPLLIAQTLTHQGIPCAFHNPSHEEVVFGLRDVGDAWKSDQKGPFSQEEYIGAMTTAPLNSCGLNPSAYTTVVEYQPYNRAHLTKIKQELDEYIAEYETAFNLQFAPGDENRVYGQAILDFLKNELPAFFETPTHFAPYLEKYKNLVQTAEDHYKQHKGWHSLHPILKGILGILATITVIPALLVAAFNKHGYRQTFFATPPTDAYLNMQHRHADMDIAMEDIEKKPKI